ncbi:MAG: hypothetical protein NTV46_19490 [Verrucomicrobia bacterium]|nr:hypothetical protein [Verrucomicrobiota bacterium]
MFDMESFQKNHGAAGGPEIESHTPHRKKKTGSPPATEKRHKAFRSCAQVSFSGCFVLPRLGGTGTATLNGGLSINTAAVTNTSRIPTGRGMRVKLSMTSERTTQVFRTNRLREILMPDQTPGCPRGVVSCPGVEFDAAFI